LPYAQIQKRLSPAFFNTVQHLLLPYEFDLSVLGVITHA
jgi:hypothetical protein